MTIETETILIKLLEELKTEFKELRQDVNQVNVNLARLDGKVETLDVKIENLQKGQDEQKSELKKTNEKVENLTTLVSTQQKGQDEIKLEQRNIRNEMSGLYKWVIVLIVGSGLSLGTLLLKAFDFFPKA